MDARIRYLAIVSEQPDTLARFYTSTFGMRELGRSGAGDVALTDGFYNLSILKPRDSAEEPGLSHFGLENSEVGFTLEHLAHTDAILLFVALRARRPNSRTAAGVEQPELDTYSVGYLAHHAA